MIYKKILIVDDDSELLKVLEKRLQQEGYKVASAIRGREAVKKAKYYLPHVIVMDIVLPDIDGAEAAKLLQEDIETVGIPIIFLSGIVRGQEGERLAEIKVGDRHYKAIAKPFPLEDLIALIKATAKNF